MKPVLAVVLLILSSSHYVSAGQLETFYENASGTPLLSLIHHSRNTLDIEIYEMDDAPVLSEIRSAVDRGVRVRIVKEDKPVGGTCRVFESRGPKDSANCQEQKDLVSYVRNGGGQYVAFNHAALCGISGSSCFEHGKMVMVDREKTLVSTGNFNSSNLCDKAAHPGTCNRDYSVVTEDSQVMDQLGRIFENDLKGVAYRVSDIVDPSESQTLTVSPNSLSPLVAFIQSARAKVQIQNQYLKDPDLNQALIDASRRGVKVEVMVESVCGFGKPTQGELTKWNATYQAFAQAGIQSRAFTRNIRVNGVAGYLHAKAILVDESRAWVGSVNGSATSLSDNREFGLFLNDAAEVSKLQSFMDSDFSNPSAESWQDSAECRQD